MTSEHPASLPLFPRPQRCVSSLRQVTAREVARQRAAFPSQGEWPPSPSCFSQLLAPLSCYQFEEGRQAGSKYSLPTCQPRRRRGLTWSLLRIWAKPRTVDGGGLPFSGVQVTGRGGTGVVPEQGSGALTVKASSKGLRPGPGCTFWICSSSSAQDPALGNDPWVLLLTFRAGIPDATPTLGPTTAKSSELGAKKLCFTFYSTINWLQDLGQDFPPHCALISPFAKQGLG